MPGETPELFAEDVAKRNRVLPPIPDVVIGPLPGTKSGIGGNADSTFATPFFSAFIYQLLMQSL